MLTNRSRQLPANVLRVGDSIDSVRNPSASIESNGNRIAKFYLPSQVSDNSARAKVYAVTRSGSSGRDFLSTTRGKWPSLSFVGSLCPKEVVGVSPLLWTADID